MKASEIFTILIVALEFYVVLNAIFYAVFLTWTDKFLRKKTREKGLDIWLISNKVRGEFFYCNFFTWPKYIKKYKRYVENL